MVRVLIADDHPFILKGLRQTLSETMDLEVAAEAQSGEEVLCQVQTETPDVVVLDLTMPGGDGMDVLQRLRTERPGLPVLILSMHQEDQYALRMLKAGAAGYITKAQAPRTVVEAIRKVAQGGRYVSPHMAEELAACLGTGSEKPPHESLSEREFQVLRRIAGCQMTGEIAEALSVSPKTVCTYRARILQKLGLRNDVEIAHYALRHKLVE